VKHRLIFLSSPRISWYQPRPFLALKRAAARTRRPWWLTSSSITLFTFIGMLFDVLLKRSAMPGFHLLPELMTKAPAIMACSILVGFGGIWLIERLPSFVALHDLFLRIDKMRIWYDDIESFDWQEADGHRILVLHRLKRDEIAVGVPPGVPKDDVTDFLSKRIRNLKQIAPGRNRRWKRTVGSGH
jgi:hypothetical protein